MSEPEWSIYPLVPRASYRLQLHAGFGFAQAAEVVPYLARLGISHVYCSPYLKAAPGSMHGYDVVDTTELNPELGSADDFARFCAAIADHGMLQMLDIVPNHMGVGSAQNRWWDDVLKNGQDSPHATTFDIDWAASPKVILPVLGDSLRQVIQAGELALRRTNGDGEWRLHYHERSLPLSERSIDLIRGLGSEQPPESDPGFLDRLLEAQHYRLVHWREAARSINYRRFFDVTDLAALRVEDPVVFDKTHRLILELVGRGVISALRIDHPDGLRDPGGYFESLQQEIARVSAPPTAHHRFYLVAEKIVAPHEHLPDDWAVAGTTGYDFANQVGGLMLDGDSTVDLDRVWREFTNEQSASFAQLAYESKREILLSSFEGELDRVVRLASAALAQVQRKTAGSAAPDNAVAGATALKPALIEIVAEFPVYRTYLGRHVSPADRENVNSACRRAIDRLAGDASDARASRAIESIRELLLSVPTRARSDHADFIACFQQLTAPVMAKGIEDTAIYRWTRLMSVNGVGGDPDVMGLSVDRFHAAAEHRRQHWPHAMLATSTHDNKRSEDVRMRINRISEMPDAWADIAGRWRSRILGRCRSRGESQMPDDSDLYLLFQTVVGAYPTLPHRIGRQEPPAISAEQQRVFGERLKGYVRKACREGKRRTSWTDPDHGYEALMDRVVDDLLDPGDRDLGTVAAQFHYQGGLSSLSLCTLKTTLPGVPDIYQGADLLDDSLVDPDNRRAVDFGRRRQMLDEFDALDQQTAQSRREALADWLACADIDRLKLWTLSRILGFRASDPRVTRLFENGDYVPIAVRGPKARFLVCFLRRLRHGLQESTLLVAVPRLPHRLGLVPGVSMTDSHLWRDTVVDLPAASVRAGSFRDVLTGHVISISEGLFPVHALFSGPTCAVLYDPGRAPGPSQANERASA